MSSPIKPVIFLHIPKTAGTTVHYILNNKYRGLKSFTSTNYTQGEIFKNLSEQERSHIAVLKGHFPFGLHEYCPKPATYFTFLREPVKRCISEYYHIHGDRNFGWLAQHNYSLKEMVEGGHYWNFDNCHVRFMAGANHLPFGAVNEETYQKALYNFENSLQIFGLQERFDESILYISKKLHWSLPFYIPANEYKGKPAPVDEETLRVVRNVNKYDIALYEYAAKKFDEMIKAEGVSFQRDLRRFQKLNRMQAPLRKFVRNIWLKLRKLSRS